VSLKDKEASFIGSSNWIGAIELSYILDEYLGVTSKVRLRISSLLQVLSVTGAVCYIYP
jgi:hypothetical protein